MISVCMATYNGERYIQEQIDSILCQLGPDDELIISDDHSQDKTVEIIKQYKDPRIKFLFNKGSRGVTHNFENAMREANGDIIFFSDQDDVWLPTKIQELSQFLKDGNYDMVCCNCALTDSNLNVIQPQYYTTTSPLDRNVISNWIKNIWLGSCMALTRNTLTKVMPMPPKAVAHDFWIALYCQKHLRCGYLPKVLSLYRRHGATVSFAGSRSTNSMWFRIQYRMYIAWYLMIRK